VPGLHLNPISGVASTSSPHQQASTGCLPVTLLNVRKTVVAPCEYALTDDGVTLISWADAVAAEASKNMMIARTLFTITLVGLKTG
jgi:hypothetical protein